MISFENLIAEAKQNNITRFSIGIIVFKNNSILVLKRKKDDFMPEIYDLPGGGVEKNETLQEAIKRELNEETRLDLNEIKSYVGYFDYNSQSGKQTRQFNVEATVKSLNKKIILSEHSDFIWVKLEQLKEIPISQETKNILEKSFRIRGMEK